MLLYLKARSNPLSVLINMLDCDIVLSKFDSSHIITFTLRLKPLGKV